MAALAEACVSAEPCFPASSASETIPTGGSQDLLSAPAVGMSGIWPVSSVSPWTLPHI